MLYREGRGTRWQDDKSYLELIPETDTSHKNVDVHQLFRETEAYWLYSGDELAVWKLLVATGSLEKDMALALLGRSRGFLGEFLAYEIIKGYFLVLRSF